MRRFLVAAVFAFGIVAMLAPPVLAQGPPAPKVTITGTFDQVTSAGRNIYDGNFSRDGEKEWYARTRFRPDFDFSVGRTHAVLGIELDLMYGQAGVNDGGFPANNTGRTGGVNGGTKFATGGALDANTDVAGLFEIKWIYTEFDITGKDSLLPFIPVLTVARAGGQPFGTIATYKQSAYASGDFAGLDLYTTFTPDIRTHLAYVLFETNVADYKRGPGGQSPPNQNFQRGRDDVWIISPEFTPTKGLDLKPLFSWFHADGLTNRISRNANFNIRTSGGSMNGAGAYCNSGTLAPSVTTVGVSAQAGATGGVASVPGLCSASGDPSFGEERYTIGLDTRWRIGPFGLDPTLYYQWGHYDTEGAKTNGTVGKVRGDAASWLFDVIASYQLGPLLLEARGTYSPGNKARDNLSTSKRYFEPVDTDSGWWTGWGNIMAGGIIDYFNGGGGPTNSMSTNVGYDRYGSGRFALRATYSITPALSVYGIVMPMWSAEKVDTNSTVVLAPQQTYTNRSVPTGAPTQTGFLKGTDSYIGTELTIGTTWRFAPNTSFDIGASYFSAGAAENTAEMLNGNLTKRDANDGYVAAARVRLSF